MFKRLIVLFAIQEAKNNQNGLKKRKIAKQTICSIWKFETHASVREREIENAIKINGIDLLTALKRFIRNEKPNCKRHN